MSPQPAQVGAPDPTLETSPIVDEDTDLMSFDIDQETGACYFNGATYEIGAFVLSGSEVLHCEERGVWVRRGEARPEGSMEG